MNFLESVLMILTFYVASQCRSSEISAARSEGICFARLNANRTQHTLCVVVSQPLVFFQPDRLKVSPCCFGVWFNKRFTFISITQFYLSSSTLSDLQDSVCGLCSSLLFSRPKNDNILFCFDMTIIKQHDKKKQPK